MSSNPKQAWADIDEDEEGVESQQIRTREDTSAGGRHEYARIKKTVEKVGADGNPEKSEQTFMVKKWVFPVRRGVMERKKLQKFGDVKDIPKGEHRPGDYTIEPPIQIDKAEEQGEIGIVSQIENISTQKVLQNIGKREAEKPLLDKGGEEKKEDKWAAMFKNPIQKNSYSIRVTSIISYEDNLQDIEEDLQEYFKTVLEKKGLRYHRLRLLKTRDTPPRFINKAILTFENNETAAKAIDVIDGATYNDAILEASWAEPADPNRRR